MHGILLPRVIFIASTLEIKHSMRKNKVNSKKKNNNRLAQPTKVRFGNQAFPPQLFNTLRYSEQVTVTLNGSGESTYIFSCNGLYDPNITGTGHQPLYFDQLTSIYDHYTCLSSRITVLPTITATSGPFILGVYVDDDTTGLTGLSSLVERPGVKYQQVNVNAGQSSKLTNNWSASRVFGPGTQADPSMQGSAASNPTEQSYYFVFVGGNTTLAASAVSFLVTIEYHVVWDEYVTVGQS